VKERERGVKRERERDRDYAGYKGCFKLQSNIP
jgi:hypothetical protein